MVKRILLTGVRTPAGLALLNNLTANGYQVYCADSCQYPIIRFSKKSSGYHIFPSPRFQSAMFKEKLIALCIEYKIDLIIPLCEEIFYISQIMDKMPQGTEVFSERFDLLISLHNKKNILRLAEGLAIKIPKTKLLTADTSFESTQNNVIKQVYSRFGTACYKHITKIQLEKLKQNSADGWLLQEYILGEERCSYSVAFQGKLLAHTAYIPKHRLYGSASIYFDPIEDQGIHDFCLAFIKKYNFTGQIAFDFIHNKNGLHIIECNPRTTSGLFLLAHHDLSALFVNKQTIPSTPDSPQMLASAMLTHGLLDAVKQKQLKGWWKDFRLGQDVLKKQNCQLKTGTRLLIFFVAIFSLIMGGKNFRKQTTEDIEYPP
jgi:predicted ATP-grasp superfamily ATP-dependent carboligase